MWILSLMGLFCVNILFIFLCDQWNNVHLPYNGSINMGLLLQNHMYDTINLLEDEHVQVWKWKDDENKKGMKCPLKNRFPLYMKTNSISSHSYIKSNRASRVLLFAMSEDLFCMSLFPSHATLTISHCSGKWHILLVPKLEIACCPLQTESHVSSLWILFLLSFIWILLAAIQSRRNIFLLYILLVNYKYSKCFRTKWQSCVPKRQHRKLLYDFAITCPILVCQNYGYSAGAGECISERAF